MSRHISWRVIAPWRSFLSRHKSAGAVVERLLLRVPRLQDALFELVRDDPVARYESWVAAYDEIDDHDLLAMRKELLRFRTTPTLSVVVSVAGANEATLEGLVESLLAQVYEHWEVFFIEDRFAAVEVASSIAETTGRDERFRSLHGGAEAWRAALRSAEGEFAVLLDHRLLLRPHALYLLAYTIDRHPEAVLVYADDDVIDDSGVRSDHYFKPDWNEALFCSQNYFGGLVAFSRGIALRAGGCSDELDDEGLWGLFLRMATSAPGGTIHHLPYVLSHRRAGGASREDHKATKQVVARAQEERLAQLGRPANVEPIGESSYRTRYVLPENPPETSIIIPSSCRLELLRPCLDGVLNGTSYPDLEVLLVVNEVQREVAGRRNYLDSLDGDRRLRVLYHDDRPFNFSWANNWAVEQARGELICFLNDDTRVIGSDWLSAMVAHVLQDRVAAVGAMLYYPTDRIQHAGVILGVGGLAGHALKGRPRGFSGYHDRGVVDQDTSCITAACMLVRRDAFLSVGGFDEALATAFNDVDICLRLRDAGWRIVWTPSAELYHRESVSIGRHDAGDREDLWLSDWDLLRHRWGARLTSDPHYNPNLSLDRLQLWDLAFPPRISYPWRARRAAADGTAESKVSA